MDKDKHTHILSQQPEQQNPLRTMEEAWEEDQEEPHEETVVVEAELVGEGIMSCIACRCTATSQLTTSLSAHLR